MDSSQESDPKSQELRKEPILAYVPTVISLMSAFVWAPTWRIATVAKAKVTWVKTKNCVIIFIFRNTPGFQNWKISLRYSPALT